MERTCRIQHALDNGADHDGFSHDDKLEAITRYEGDVFAGSCHCLYTRGRVC